MFGQRHDFVHGDAKAGGDPVKRGPSEILQPALDPRHEGRVHTRLESHLFLRQPFPLADVADGFAEGDLW